MTANFVTAEDEINSMFLAGWRAGAPAIVGYEPEIRWTGKQELNTPGTDKHWCRFGVQQVDSAQVAMGTRSNNAEGARRYTDYGFLIVELFCPKSDGAAWMNGKRLAQMAREIFRGKSTPSCVWFRNVRIIPIAPETNFYRLHVIADYEYDEIK